MADVVAILTLRAHQDLELVELAVGDVAPFSLVQPAIELADVLLTVVAEQAHIQPLDLLQRIAPVIVPKELT